MTKQMIITAGLPGTGKTTIAEGLAKQLRFPILSMDPIVAALWHHGIPRELTEDVEYAVSGALADAQLKLGLSVIIDAVNKTEAPREMWRQLARRQNAQIVIIEVVCSDEAVHRQRLERRTHSLPGMVEPTWGNVLADKASYASWSEEDRLVLDAVEPADTLTAKALDYVLSKSTKE